MQPIYDSESDVEKGSCHPGVFGDNYLSPLATIKNPHRGVVKTLRRGGLVKR